MEQVAQRFGRCFILGGIEGQAGPGSEQLDHFAFKVFNIFFKVFCLNLKQKDFKIMFSQFCLLS